MNRTIPRSTQKCDLLAVASLLLLVPLFLAAAPQEQPARILLVTGMDYPGHVWKQTAPVLKEILQKHPLLDVRVSEDPHLLDSASLSNYDAVVLHFMDWEQPSPGPAVRERLKKCIAGGQGLVLVHFACGAWQDWPEFSTLAGRVWDPKLRGHDPRGPFQVHIADPSHSVTQGLKDFETDDELYTCLTGTTPIHILASARSKVDGKDYPMAFVLSHGQGRVFHTVLGHDVKALTHSSVPDLLRRGCAWAAHAID